MISLVKKYFKYCIKYCIKYYVFGLVFCILILIFYIIRMDKKEGMDGEEKNQIVNIPKVIYLSYKENIPNYVIEKWKSLNPDYHIDFNLDKDCISFLKNECSQQLADLFKEIPKGMHKCDLWRLCKLYLHGGVYADVDLVPHVSVDEMIKENATFYSCKSINSESIFQALLISTPKNPILLTCLMSFIMHRPYKRDIIGPTKDMYKAISNYILKSEVPSNILKPCDNFDIYFKLGRFTEKKKVVHLPIPFFIKNKKYIWFTYPFDITRLIDIKFTSNKQILVQVNNPLPKNVDYFLVLRIYSKESLFMFQEINPDPKPEIANCYVSYKGKKLLDSRDKNYFESRSANRKWK